MTEVMRLQLNRLAVGRAVGRVVPGAAVALEFGGRAGALGRQLAQPMSVVRVAQVAIAASLDGGDLGRQRIGSFRPAEEPAFMQPQHHRERTRLPGFAKHRRIAAAGHGGRIGPQINGIEIYTHVLKVAAGGTPSPLDSLLAA